MPDSCLTPVWSLAITNVVVEGVMMPKQEELATRKDLKKLEDTLTAKIDANAAKIDANAAKIDQVKRNLGAKIDANSEAISKLTSLVLHNKDAIKRMATKEDMDRRFDEVVNILDGLAHSFSILEQEKVVVDKRLDRIEAKLA